MITMKRQPWWWKVATGITYSPTVRQFERGDPVSLCALFWAIVGPWLLMLASLGMVLGIVGMLAYDIWSRGHLLGFSVGIALIVAGAFGVRFLLKWYSTSDTAHALVAAAKARVCPLIRWERD